MNITAIGNVGPGLYVLGSNRMPSYLMVGKRPILFEGGLSCLGPAYKKDLNEILNGRSPEILFLTHVHFDHCGGAGFLKKSFPGMRIAGSKKASEIITRPGALGVIAELNQVAGEVVRKWHPDLVSEESFQPFQIDRILSDGDRIELEDDLCIEVLATPGHTWDSLSYYLPRQKILFASESAGLIDHTGFMITEFLVDYEAYLDSIRRLSVLDVDILCQGHGSVFTGQEAKTFFGRSLQAAREFKERIEDYLRIEGGDIPKTIHRIKQFEYDPKPEPKQPEPAYLLNIEARVRHLAKG